MEIECSMLSKWEIKAAVLPELKQDSSFNFPFALVLIGCSPFYYDSTQI